MLAHSQDFVFIAVPKTASTSINHVLKYGSHPEPHLYHRSISEVPNAKHWFSFAFVRNPWDRLLSCYCDFKQNRGRKYSGKVRMSKPMLHEFKNFHQFCEVFPTTTWAKDIHFRSQHTFLEVNDKLAVNFVGKFERLIEDFTYVCDQLSLPKTLIEQLKKTQIRPSRHSTYKNNYTDNTKRIIGDFFKKDIELFEYEF